MDELNALVLSVQSGDRAAFGKLVERFQDMAFALAYARVSDVQQAQDIVQEALLEAYLHIGELAIPVAFPSWLRTIVYRQVSRFTRRQQERALPLEEMATYVATAAAPATVVETQELQTLVQRTIYELPEHERVVILLYYLADYSQKEIAAALDLRLSTVKSRLYDARQRLRERIPEMLQDYLHNQRPSKDQTFVTTMMALVAAIEEGNTPKAVELLDTAPHLLTAVGRFSYEDSEQQPLFLAIQAGNLDLIAALLTKGVDINAPNAQGWTLLNYALVWRHPGKNIADFLIERGAVSNIFALVQMGQQSQLAAQLQATPTAVHTRGPDGATPLHFAPTVEIAELLLKYGADINARDVHNRPPLGYQFSAAVNQFLLQKGAVVDDIFLACEVGALEIVQALVAANPTLATTQTDATHPLGPSVTPLLRAALNGHSEVVRYLLQYDDKVNHQGGGGWGVAPIHAATLAGSLATIQLLVEHAADVNQRMERGGETALHWAAEYPQHTAIVRYLLEQGATVDAQTKQGATPLYWAIPQGSLESIKLLIDHGANPNLKSGYGDETPLMKAQRLQRTEVVQLLEPQ